jgi:hypothetical protein
MYRNGHMWMFGKEAALHLPVYVWQVYQLIDHLKQCSYNLPRGIIMESPVRLASITLLHKFPLHSTTVANLSHSNQCLPLAVYYTRYVCSFLIPWWALIFYFINGENCLLLLPLCRVFMVGRHVYQRLYLLTPDSLSNTVAISLSEPFTINQDNKTMRGVKIMQ